MGKEIINLYTKTHPIYLTDSIFLWIVDVIFCLTAMLRYEQQSQGSTASYGSANKDVWYKDKDMRDGWLTLGIQPVDDFGKSQLGDPQIAKTMGFPRG